MLLVEMSADARTPADLREGALHIACAAKCTEPQYTELCPEALDELRKHTDKREVVWACCIGCGATHGLKRCAKCDKARSCGMACIRRMWSTHNRCCKEWAEQRDSEEDPTTNTPGMRLMWRLCR